MVGRGRLGLSLVPSFDLFFLHLLGDPGHFVAETVRGKVEVVNAHGRHGSAVECCFFLNFISLIF